MAKERITIPKTTKDKLLKEYNHRCSICGTNNPHIHHIDENPSNNDIDNLIPLCPNCHLIDQHNPTSHISPNKLKLFRKYKDPAILSYEFEPLFRRLMFLDDVYEETDRNHLSNCIKELSEFVSSLRMGDFYSKEIKKIITPPSAYQFGVGGDEGFHTFGQDSAVLWKIYIQDFCENREKIQSLCVELLRYQDWQYKSKNS